MILKFATKRDTNGNRLFLGFDNVKCIYALESASWYSVEDVTIVTRKERQKLIEACEKEGFKRVDTI